MYLLSFSPISTRPSLIIFSSSVLSSLCSFDLRLYFNACGLSKVKSLISRGLLSFIGSIFSSGGDDTAPSLSSHTPAVYPFGEPVPYQREPALFPDAKRVVR